VPAGSYVIDALISLYNSGTASADVICSLQYSPAVPPFFGGGRATFLPGSNVIMPMQDAQTFTASTTILMSCHFATGTGQVSYGAGPIRAVLVGGIN
jgi:hypothetical protein